MLMNERMLTMTEDPEICGVCGFEYGEHCEDCGACPCQPHDECCGW